MQPVSSRGAAQPPQLLSQRRAASGRAAAAAPAAPHAQRRGLSRGRAAAAATRSDQAAPPGSPLPARKEERICSWAWVGGAGGSTRSLNEPPPGYQTACRQDRALCEQPEPCCLSSPVSSNHAGLHSRACPRATAQRRRACACPTLSTCRYAWRASNRMSYLTEGGRGRRMRVRQAALSCRTMGPGLLGWGCRAPRTLPRHDSWPPRAGVSPAGRRYPWMCPAPPPVVHSNCAARRVGLLLHLHHSRKKGGRAGVGGGTARAQHLPLTSCCPAQGIEITHALFASPLRQASRHVRPRSRPPVRRHMAGRRTQ